MATPEQPQTTRLHLERVIPARPERVFGAFTDPEQLRHWWGPVGFTVQSLQFDALEGADYRIVMQPPDAEVFHIRGTFHTVDAPSRLAYTFIYEEPDPDDLDTLVTLTFDPNHQGTRLVVEQEPFKTAARRDLHRDGWTETLARLEQSLT